MRKKAHFKKIVHDFPERIFVNQRNPQEFAAWLALQQQDRSLQLELGMGSGDYLIQKALVNPELFFLGLEVKEDRIFKAFLKAERLNCTNIAFLQTSVQKLPEYKLPNIDTVYILFPDPWPKKRHSRRRLTSESFLQLYRSLLESDGKLIFKTDNCPLFDYSKESFEDNNWVICEENDNYLSPPEEQTYYERRFLSESKKINYLRASLVGNV